MAHPKKHLTTHPDVGQTAGSSQPRPPRFWTMRRLAATAATSTLLSVSVVGGPLAAVGLGVAPAAAQSSVLNQTGPAAPQKAASTTSGSQSTAKGGGNSAGADLDVAPNWNAPGIKQGKELIGWAKAGAMVLGVLGMIGGIVGGKVLKEAGNHHASGVRSTALGIGGAMVIAGAAPTLIPALMG